MAEKWIKVGRASSITGYSIATVLRACHEKKVAAKMEKKPWMVEESSVLAWAQAHRKQGGQFMPRKRRKVAPKKSGAWHAEKAAENVWLMKNGSDEAKATIICSDFHWIEKLVRLVELAEGI